MPTILLSKAMISYEILYLLLRLMEDRGGIPETVVPGFEQRDGEVGFGVTEDHATGLAVRLSWRPSDGFLKFSAEVWPKNRPSPVWAKFLVDPSDMTMPLDDFSARYLLPIASVMANTIDQPVKA